jgi:predicted dehydrogenase
MDQVRIGVIGCGVMGPKHVEASAQLPMTRPVAVADLIEERARRTAEAFGIEKVYRSGDELLEDPDVDAVVLAFPAQHRARLAIRAFQRGKHVLTEKPVAANAAQVRRMIRAQGRLVGACCSCRYAFVRHAAAVRDFIATGALGALRLVRARSLAPCGPKPETLRPDWRLKRKLNGGGILMNWGCYDIDYLMGLTGWSLRPQTVFAQTWPIPPHLRSHVVPGSDAETYYTALVRCRGGAVISLERGEYMPAAGDDAWQIMGTRGSVRLTMTATKGKKVYHDDATVEGGVVTRVLWEGDENWGDARSEPMRDFAEAILHRRKPTTDLRKSLVVQQISDAIYASAARGQAVAIR